VLKKSEYEVEKDIRGLEQNKIILSYNTLINWQKFGDDTVTAIIEVNLTPEREAVRPLRAQTLLDLCLRCNARMVAARHPKSIIALHAPPADQDVLQGFVERVPHVELPRHIRRRDHHTVRLA